MIHGKGFPGGSFDRWLNFEPESEDGPMFLPCDEPEFEHLCRICGAHWDTHDEFGYCDQKGR